MTKLWVFKIKALTCFAATYLIKHWQPRGWILDSNNTILTEDSVQSHSNIISYHIIINRYHFWKKLDSNNTTSIEDSFQPHSTTQFASGTNLQCSFSRIIDHFPESQKIHHYWNTGWQMIIVERESFFRPSILSVLLKEIGSILKWRRHWIKTANFIKINLKQWQKYLVGEGKHRIGRVGVKIVTFDRCWNTVFSALSIAVFVWRRECGIMKLYQWL